MRKLCVLLALCLLLGAALPVHSEDLEIDITSEAVELAVPEEEIAAVPVEAEVQEIEAELFAEEAVGQPGPFRRAKGRRRRAHRRAVYLPDL